MPATEQRGVAVTALNAWRRVTAAIRRVARPLTAFRDFDRRHATDTAGAIPMREYDGVTHYASEEFGYQAVPERLFHWLLRRYFQPGVFVDLGCGKGRALLMAASYPFENIVGVEISRDLCRVARENIKKVSGWEWRTATTEVICSDVLDYVFPPRDMLIFLYNPFPAAVLSVVCRNLEESLRACPRKVTMIYYNPIARAVLDGERFVRLAGVKQFFSLIDGRPLGRAAVYRNFD